jgi:hypothetical protein
MDKKQLEKYSSAFTLSDMEIFIFPDLLYSLVLANIMSPVIWKWRDDKWFANIDKMPPLKKLHRLKQYIMDNYNFNLDLDTWGLTDKQSEISRFSEFMDMDTLRQSNALFGYEGDKYYFDIDIRRHFGLEKYDDDIIPYWKTETVEAMDAFRFKPGYTSGAGECVSLASLYAAALFVVAKVPLENIFVMGTPLHSQNFIMIDEGVLTNNRRIVTRAMWYNGTELSSLARRALEHEKITVVAHPTGWIHFIYPEASIDEEQYRVFREKLGKFLETSVSFEIFINFLRSAHKFQKLFYFVFLCQGSNRYVKLEKAFGYEHGSKYRLGDKSCRNLLCEMDEEDLLRAPEEERVTISDQDEIFKISNYQDFIHALDNKFPSLRSAGIFEEFKKFVHTVPKLPSAKKFYQKEPSINITTAQTRDEILRTMSDLRKHSVIADLAFYAGRFMESCDWKPFFKASFERNPVSVDYFLDNEIHDVYEELKSWDPESIYEGNRLALPDEVVNYKHGDGLEKAITLANVLHARHSDVSLEQQGSQVTVKCADGKYEFSTSKALNIGHIRPV